MLTITSANNWFRRLVGLMGRGSLADDEGFLIPRCRQAHTMFMRFDIDAVFFDSEGTVITMCAPLSPWRLSPKVAGATSCLELAAGGAKRNNLRVGQTMPYGVLFSLLNADALAAATGDESPERAPDWTHHQAGQAIAEAALVIPILLFLLTAIFVAGQWFNAKLVATAAAREGARAGALTGEWQCAYNAALNSFSVIRGKLPTITLFSKTGKDEKEIARGQALPLPRENLTVKVEFSPTYVFSHVYDPTNGSSAIPQFGAVSESATSRMEVIPGSQTPCLKP